MGGYASGKRSWAISDRSGLRFPYSEMVREWNGFLVHTSEYEPKQPQLSPKPVGSDPQALWNPRPSPNTPDLSEIANACLPEAYLPIILHLHKMFVVK